MTEETKKREDHDQIFKTVIREFFKEFLELFLPKLANEIDFNHVHFENNEHFSDQLTGEKKSNGFSCQSKTQKWKRRIHLHSQ